MERALYLAKRDQALAYQLSSENNTRLLTPPTNKLLFNWIYQDTGFAKDITEHENLRIDAVTRFEMLNLLIKESFAHCQVEHLEKATIDLLRASVQLHPILSGERQDLGHPDEACSYYGILEPIFINTHPLHNKFISLLYLKDEIENKLKSDCLTSKNDNLNNLKLFSLFIDMLKDSENIINTFPDITPGELPLNKKLPSRETDLLEIKRTMDIGFIHGHYRPRKVFMPLMGLGTKTLDKTPVICVMATDYKLSRWPYPLPEPDFLKPTSISEPRPSSKKQLPSKQKKRRARKTRKRNKQQQPLKNSNSTAQNLTSIKEKEASTVGTEIAAIESNVDERNLKPFQQNMALTLFNQETSVAAVLLPSIEKEAEPIEKEKKKEITPLPPYQLQEAAVTTQQLALSVLDEYHTEPHAEKKEQRVWSFENDWELPRGLRTFHNRMFSNTYSPHTAKNNQHQFVVDRLFDPQQKCTVTFKEFKILWKSEKGSIIENKGGSHKDLIAPRGEKLFGIFAHGNQTYGADYVKYLQTAILYIGLRPSYPLSTVYK